MFNTDNYNYILDCKKKNAHIKCKTTHHINHIIDMIQNNIVDIKCNYVNYDTYHYRYYKKGYIYENLKHSLHECAKKYCKCVHTHGIGNQLNDIYSKYHSDIMNIMYTKNTREMNPLLFHSKLYDIFFIPVKIIRTIENKYNHRHIYRCSDESNVIQFTVYTSQSNRNEYFSKICKLGKIGLTIMKSQRITHAVIDIYIWMTLHKKKMKNCIKNCYLGTDEINSGATIRKITEKYGTVFIWRKEELEKVFIHELIHALRLDFYEYPKKLDKLVTDNYNIKSSLRINIFEAYTETWACILNIIMNCILDNHDNILEKVYTCIHFEMHWSIYQIRNILNYFKIFHLQNEDFFCLQCSSFNTPSLFKQKTNVFSYFILKTYFINHLDTFLDLCSIYNDNYIKFKIPFHKLHIFIKKILKDNKILKDIDSYMYSTYKNSHSLKMTICDFK